MRELLAIVEACDKMGPADRPALATVVDVRGSAYRRPGARMLICPDGSTVGAISGGCLESDVRERAFDVMETGRPALTIYDTSSPDDLVLGTGLGCSGVVTVWIERIDPTDPCGPIAFLKGCIRDRKSGVIATVLKADSNTGPAPGAAIMLREDGIVGGDLPSLRWAGCFTHRMRKALCDARSGSQSWADESGRIEVFLNVHRPAVPLTIFGGGYDAIPLAQLAGQMGWYVTVVDHRPAYAAPERFPLAGRVMCIRPEEMRDRLTTDPPLVVMVMTHHYETDREIVRIMRDLSPLYLGVLGPRARTQRILDDLREADGAPTPAWEQRLYGPAGLDIGAETPEEIAVSIVAQIQAVLAGRAGGNLRESEGPIHSLIANSEAAGESFGVQ